ncbi:MAG TPA: hypothetical protein VII05_02090, partial [Gaiellaceae bacterium]
AVQTLTAASRLKQGEDRKLNYALCPADTNSRLEHTMKAPEKKKGHTHRQVTVRALGQQSGVPYEVERTLCGDCHQIIAERPLRRAAA